MDIRPLFGCQICYEDHSWLEDDLVIYDGYPLCEMCYDELKYEEELPDWRELSPFASEQTKRIKELEAALKWLQENVDSAYTLENIKKAREATGDFLIDIRNGEDE